MSERKEKLIGNGDTNSHINSHGSEAISQALRNPAMRDVLEHETPLNYAESLITLGVPSGDVEDSTIELVTQGPLRAEQVEAVHASQAAAIRRRSGNGNH